MADYYLKTDNIMKNMFTVALKDELAAQSQMGKVRPATEAMLQKVRDYELSEKRLPITTEEQRELRNALNRLRDKYLAICTMPVWKRRWPWEKSPKGMAQPL